MMEGTSPVMLNVSPNSWLDWGAYIFLISVVLLAVYLLRRYELNRIKYTEQIKYQRVETDSLRKLDQLKSQFFANITHEFRTPLTLLLGELENVISSGIDEESKAKLLVAEKNARRLLTLINQLMDLSKLEAGSMELHPAQADLVSFLRDLLSTFDSLVYSKRITVLFNTDTDCIRTYFDPDKMQKIFNNLLSNALKFTEPGGHVRVAITTEKPGLVVITVTDSGPCIPEDQLPLIFNRFYQADVNSVRRHEGSGVGLTLAHELIEMHHGQISVTSREGEGTTFIVSLPIEGLKEKLSLPLTRTQKQDLNYSAPEKIETVHTNAPGKLPVVPADAAGEIILILEDDLEMRTFIREQLESDYIIMEAGNGKAGLQLARNSIPDLIIADIMLPGMDGCQFCSDIRGDERTCHIPVIMLTAKASTEDKIEGLETGADDYITKPFSTRELKVRIKNLLDQRRMLRARFSQSASIRPSEISPLSMDQVFLEKTINFIESHFEDPDFTVDLLAKKSGMSVSQLNRKLNALIDQPAGQLMRSLRLQRAADLLEKKAGTISEICYKLGFSDQAYFSRAFKKRFGCSPSEYMKG